MNSSETGKRGVVKPRHLALSIDNPEQFSRQLLSAMLAFRDGNFAVRLPADLVGIPGKIADVFNDVVAVSERRAAEVGRVCRAVGKEGRLKDAIALSSSKNYRYSHLAKVVLAGLQEYQFQQESGGNLAREDLMDTVRRSIQRASALTASDLKKGVSALATIG